MRRKQLRLERSHSVHLKATSHLETLCLAEVPAHTSHFVTQDWIW